MKWLALAIAIAANVVANIALKILARGTALDAESFRLVDLIARPSLWIGLAACAVLLGSYVYALREISVGVAYASVTSLALVLITLVSAVLFDDRLLPAKIVGIALIIVGIFLLLGSEGRASIPQDHRLG